MRKQRSRDDKLLAYGFTARKEQRRDLKQVARLPPCIFSNIKPTLNNLTILLYFRNWALENIAVVQTSNLDILFDTLKKKITTDCLNG